MATSDTATIDGASAASKALATAPASATATQEIGSGVLHQGDCIEVMQGLPDECCKLIITSPPYNLRNSSGGFWHSRNDTSSRWKNAALRSGDGYTDHDDNMPRDEYIDWQRACMAEMMRLVREDGAIFYNHKWRTQRGLHETPDAIVEGCPVRQIIIWERPGGTNFTETFFVPTYEPIYFIAKPKFRLVPDGNRFGTVWKMNPAKGNPHPAPFPVDLPKRAIASTESGLVLDPFMGSGTTAVAAERLDRPWIGIDKSTTYYEMARKRIIAEAAQAKLF